MVLRGETNQDLPKLGQKQGVYTRPSAAIERGSGFFVPGLEGPRVRLLFGSMLLLLSGINHVLSEPPLPANVITTTTGGGSDSIFAEALAVVYSTLVLLQGAVELRKEGLRPRGIVAGVGTKHSTAGNAIRSYQQQWSVAVEQNGDWRERVEWAASTYLALTPATHVMLVGPGKVVYALGATEPNRDDSRGEEAAECAAALTTLAQSQSGRVSLPPAHPVVTGLTDPNYNRCVVLQRVNAQLCWVVTSDQLLAGFTQQDLQWLGQLAIYIDPESV